jgi:hypothetical protein
MTFKRTRKPWTALPIRRCQTLHFCELCRANIHNGERYHDGGYGRRAHVKCVEAEGRSK